MDEKKKLAMLEEALEMEEGELKADMELEGLDEYNSLSKLSIIVMMSDEFGKKLTNDQVKAFSTVQDILDCMG